MTRQVPLRSKLLFALCIACPLLPFAAWAFLLTTICSNPRTPCPETHHVTAYGCHGMTVFISDLESAMLHWIIPIRVPSSFSWASLQVWLLCFRCLAFRLMSRFGSWMRQVEIQIVASEVRALSSNNALQPTCTASRCSAVHSLAALGAAERER